MTEELTNNPSSWVSVGGLRAEGTRKLGNLIFSSLRNSPEFLGTSAQGESGFVALKLKCDLRLVGLIRMF